MSTYRSILAFAVLSLLCACNETDEGSGKVIITEDASHMPDWLTTHDQTEPAVWLRSKEVRHRTPPSDAEVGRLRRALKQAADRFFEDPRMIANRTAQTGVMLAEAKQPERYVDILTGLIDVADASSVKKLFGEMCQHYLNIRKDGRDRSAAIEQLKAAYKSSRSPGLTGKVP